MSLNETINNLGDSIINLVDKKRQGILGLEQGEVGYDKQVWNDINKYKHSTFDASKFNSLFDKYNSDYNDMTVTENGIASNFNESPYFNSYKNINTIYNKFATANSWSIWFSFRHNGFYEGGSRYYPLGFVTNIDGKAQLLDIAIGDNAFRVTFELRLGTEGDAWTSFSINLPSTLTNEDIISTNITFNSSYGYTGAIYINGQKYGESTLANTTKLYYPEDANKICIVGNYKAGLISSYPHLFLGDIDLKYFTIEANGVEVLSFNKTGVDVYKEDNYSTSGTAPVDENGVVSLDVPESGAIYKSVPITTLKSLRIVGEWTYKNTKPGWSHALCQINPINDKIVSFDIDNSNRTTIYIARNWFHSESVPLSLPVSLNNKDIIYFDILIENNSIKYDITVMRGALKYHKSDIMTTTNNTTIDINSNVNLIVGYNSSTYGWTGSVNLNTVRWYINNELVWQPMLRIPYIETKAGYKVVSSEWRSCLKQLKEGKGNVPYYTIYNGNEEKFYKIGSPNIANKILTPTIYNNNYIYTQSIYFSNNWKIKLKVKPNTLQNSPLLYQRKNGGVYNADTPTLGFWSNTAYFEIWKNNIRQFPGLTTALTPGIDTWVELGYKNGIYYMTTTTDKNNYTYKSITSDVSIDANVNLSLGCNAAQYFDGDIYLSEFEVYTNDELVCTLYTKPSYTLPMGDVYGVLSAKSNSSEIAHYSMPSEVYTDLTIGETGATYTAPADGYFVVQLKAGAVGEQVVLRVLEGSVEYLTSTDVSASNDQFLRAWLPIRKGEDATLLYTTTGTSTANYLRFIYAEGSKGEKQ